MTSTYRVVHDDGSGGGVDAITNLLAYPSLSFTSPPPLPILPPRNK